MGVGSISFYQQDQNYWNQQQSGSQATSAQDSLINVMASAESNLSKGLASIANETALKRVNSKLSAAVQSALQSLGDTALPSSSASTGSSSSSSISSPAGSASSSSASSSPATGTSRASVSTSTSLLTLGIPAGGSITIGAGTGMTTYASTGTDTVGDMMNAINADFVGNAAVTASLNRNGQLVITSKNDTDTVTVSGIYASNTGFGVGNDTFKPTKTAANSANSSSSPASSSSTGNTSPTASSTSTSTNSSTNRSTVPTILSENISTAASILSASGASGSLVDMLA